MKPDPQLRTLYEALDREAVAKALDLIHADWGVDSVGRTGAYIKTHTREQAVEAILAFQQARPAEGWVLVPREPILSMIHAAQEFSRSQPLTERPLREGREYNDAINIYRAMTAAAPTALDYSPAEGEG